MFSFLSKCTNDECAQIYALHCTTWRFTMLHVWADLTAKTSEDQWSEGRVWSGDEGANLWFGIWLNEVVATMNRRWFLSRYVKLNGPGRSCHAENDFQTCKEWPCGSRGLCRLVWFGMWYPQITIVLRPTHSSPIHATLLPCTLQLWISCWTSLNLSSLWAYLLLLQSAV